MSSISLGESAVRGRSADRSLALVAILLLSAIGLYQVASLSVRVSGFYDTQIYAAAMHALLRDGQPFYGAQVVALAEMFPDRFPLANADAYDLFFYPPPSVALFSWMAWTDPLTAYRALVAAQFLAAVAMAVALYQLRPAHSPPVSTRHMGALALAMLAVVCAPVWHNSVVGNVSVMACACAVGFICFHERRPWLAGMLLAIGAVLKVYPALLLAPSLLSGRWRPALWFGVGGIVLSGLGLVWLSVGDYVFFIRKLMPWLSAYFDSQLGNQSLYGLFDRLTRWDEIPPLRGDLVRTPDWLRQTVSLIGAAILAPAMGLVYWRRRDRAFVVRMMYIALALVPLISPKGHVHVYVFATPLLFDCLCRMASWPVLIRVLLIGAAALWVLPLWTGLAYVHQAPFWFQHLWHSRFAFVTLFALALAFWDASRTLRAARTPDPA